MNPRTRRFIVSGVMVALIALAVVAFVVQSLG